jgi:hypothetical protein
MQVSAAVVKTRNARVAGEPERLIQVKPFEIHHGPFRFFCRVFPP